MMMNRLNFIEQFFDFEDLYNRFDDNFLSKLTEDYEVTDKITNSFFDYHSFYKTLKQNTLNRFKDRDELLSYLNKPVLKWGNELWDFITEKCGREPYWEVDEENVIDLTKDIMYLSFTVDTGYSNEGGSHAGGYEYIFTVDLKNKIFRELQIVNHN